MTQLNYHHIQSAGLRRTKAAISMWWNVFMKWFSCSVARLYIVNTNRPTLSWWCPPMSRIFQDSLCYVDVGDWMQISWIWFAQVPGLLHRFSADSRAILGRFFDDGDWLTDICDVLLLVCVEWRIHSVWMHKIVRQVVSGFVVFDWVVSVASEWRVCQCAPR